MSQASLFSELQRTAEFSPCMRYRYKLGRTWGPGARVAFCMLNPSTADATIDDPTIRRCMGFARAWGFDGVDIVNIFAWRSTDPAALREVSDPIGPGNDEAIVDVARRATFVVCAWGIYGYMGLRGSVVREKLLAGVDVRHLGLTKDGFPKHPLYLAGATRPERWT